LAWCAIACALPALAATVAEMAKESGCVNKPVVIGGTMYRCATESGAFSYFNVPGAPDLDPPPSGARRSASTPSPTGFPKVDPGTQKGRDDMRRKVLSDELAAEEKLLAEARAAYAGGSPPALPEERSNVEKYRERVAKLGRVVEIHDKNVEALKKEIAAMR
jgi:hypothetical protein